MVYGQRASRVQQPLQFRHRVVLITTRNEVHGFFDYAVRPGGLRDSSSILSASPQLPLYCADSPSAAGFEKEVLGQRVKSIPFQSF